MPRKKRMPTRDDLLAIKGICPAIRTVMLEVGHDLHQRPPETNPIKRRLEKAEQQAIHKLLRRAGCAWWDTSQSKKAQITPGLADIIGFRPHQLTYSLVKWRPFAIEVKVAGGWQTAPQRAFEEFYRLADIDYILGGADEVAAWLGVT